MLADIKYRWGIICSILIVAAYLIWPTYKLYSLSEEELQASHISIVKSLKESSINLGLDLQGGMYVLLEVNIPP